MLGIAIYTRHMNMQYILRPHTHTQTHATQTHTHTDRSQVTSWYQRCLCLEHSDFDCSFRPSKSTGDPIYPNTWLWLAATELQCAQAL